MDLFFWGYSKRVGFLPDLCHRITVVITVVSVDVLPWPWGELDFHFDACMAFNGAHIELHYTTVKLATLSTIYFNNKFLCQISE
jgi:succinate dehydrogenase/fumarate reductase cytochrome b subunit